MTVDGAISSWRVHPLVNHRLCENSQNGTSARYA
jgi:hypothetical protein